MSNHKIECRGGKPAALDVSLGNVSVQVNIEFVGEAENDDASVGFSFLPRGYYQLKDKIALPQANAEGIQGFNFVDGTTVWWLTRHLESIQKLREIVRANLPECRSMVK